MKIPRILFGILAVGFAASVSFASKLQSDDQIPGFIQVNSNPENCLQSTTCDNSGEYPCKVQGVQAYEKDGTSCVVALNRIQPD